MLLIFSKRGGIVTFSPEFLPEFENFWDFNALLDGSIHGATLPYIQPICQPFVSMGHLGIEVLGESFPRGEK